MSPLGPPCEICATPTEPWRLPVACSLWRCPACLHVMRDVVGCPAAARARAYGGDRDLDAWRLALTYRRILWQTRAAPPHAVFEIGFGSGALLRRFLDAGCAVGGVDPDHLGLLRDPGLAAAGSGLVAGRIEDLPEPGATYDLVYGVHVLEHLHDPRVALRRCRELLAPTGRVYFLTPTADSAGPWVFGSAWWLLEDPTHVRFFSPTSLRTTLTGAGFTEIRIRRLLLDNLSMETCSILRRSRRDPSPEGVLATRGARRWTAAGAVPTVAARALWPRLRPTLEVSARAG